MSGSNVHGRRLRRLAPVLVVASCSRAEPPATPPPPPARSTIVEAPPDNSLDWPSLIGVPMPDVQRQIAGWLRVEATADLFALGIEIQLRGDLVDTIFLKILPEEENGPVYKGPLLRGVAPTMKRADIVRVLGKPDEVEHPGGGENWIKYRRPEAQIHFAFTPENRIYMVTLMDPNWAPGRDLAPRR